MDENIVIAVTLQGDGNLDTVIFMGDKQPASRAWG